MKDAHEWTPTGCAMCHGEGRLIAYRELMFEDRGDAGRQRFLRLVSVRAASESPPGEIYSDPRRIFYSYIHRCPCEAGEAPGLPRVWTVWKDSLRRAS